ncbi:MAG: tRNA uridine-5-carboxymethylaminomethyl(34) synthesis GTPase MnmE [Terrimicrobiaceae bacterium]
MLVEDTIAAISTPPGEGAIAVIRISGSQAPAIVERLFARKNGAIRSVERMLHFGCFRDEEGGLDEGMAVVFRAPRSYTGEDMAEFHCHGGVLVASRILAAVLRAGARAAEPGEFTRRAFLNGKMDLTQAEAVMDVIRASTSLALRTAEEQLAGRLGREMEKIRSLLLGIVAHIEAAIDFPEEGIDPRTGEQLRVEIRQTRKQIENLLATANEGRLLREGVHLVLCGAPNAGKSSLLNRLLGFNRAIVSATPGTTRDTLEEFASLRGFPFKITDTAGLRETADAVEREGVERAKQAMSRADVIVRIVDVTAPWGPEPKNGEILAANKIDLVPEKTFDSRFWDSPLVAISCLTGEGIEQLVDAIVKKARGNQAPDAPTGAAINARHQTCLQRARLRLQEAEDKLQNQAAPELVALPLRDALDAVGEVVGAADIEEILGNIFSTFCIGK